MLVAAEDAKNSKDASSKEYKRYRTFLFLFAITFLHELGHLFISFLVKDGRDSPPQLSIDLVDDIHGDSTESGRLLEVLLFGGAVVPARDSADDVGQACLYFAFLDIVHELTHASGWRALFV